MMKTLVHSTGSYLPKTVLRNEELTQFSREAVRLISEKTGVLARRVASEDECTSDLAVKAAVRCLEKAGFPPEKVQCIMVSTSSPDRTQPATATRVQFLLGAVNSFAFDINSVCSGSTFGISLADSMIRSGQCGNVLFIASEVYSRILNKNDFSTYPFFGDGAGAVLFQAGDSTPKGVLRSCLMTDGSTHDVICVPGGGTMLPYEKVESQRSLYFRMKGERVMAFSIERGPEVIRKVAEESGTDLEDIRCILCHQANINIIRRISEDLGLPFARFFVNLYNYGNTASASVLIALDEAISAGAVSEGDLIITVSFGGGLSWGANLIRI
ncbi:MAG: ketoacyl-ACP synthase III [Syntrophales bacterium]|nr:ketoacyl-ACP synthase III [Syntrophales bacterium]MDD5233273.1 ketoacyl-ACP synthase III [Syntrophales bacterium]MDD5532242.1 ketoacyl-ACP synthase III [Syntrophales bacterium]HPL63107.1 ketoacyl-ACP synthase III [Syntrophales bacterium]